MGTLVGETSAPRSTAPRLLSVRAAAAYLGISAAAVWSLVAQGHLRRVQLPGTDGHELRRALVDVRDCDALVERSKESHP